MLLTGPTNSGKTFLFDPLEVIFKSFVNPANDKYGWVGADQCEVIYLNDFRWNPSLITWKDLLLLLEGHTVKLPAPKNVYTKDVCINTDVPIFASADEEFVLYARDGKINQRETEMMSVRWRVYKFSRTIPKSEQIELKPCPRCFAEFVFMDEIM